MAQKWTKYLAVYYLSVQSKNLVLPVVYKEMRVCFLATCVHPSSRGARFQGPMSGVQGSKSKVP